MEQYQVQGTEHRLYQDRGTSFRGTARVRFEHLRFGDLCPRESNEKVTATLKDRFENQGCLRLDSRHHIPAIISQATLDLAMQASPGATEAALLSCYKKLPCELKFPDGVAIECLQGLHRVAAAKRFLPRRDWWWTIDLYLDDASADLKISLSEEYSHSVNFSDGEIFMKLRQYAERSYEDPAIIFAEKRMWGRLSRDKRKDLKQIQGNKLILAGLDSLRVLPALFSGFQIPHILMPLKCPEELSHYLKRILKTFKRIFRNRTHLMSLLDPETVSIIQLRAPGYSSHDFSFLSDQFRKGKLFSKIEGPEDRNSIWESLCSVDHLILSLSSFCEDIKYISPPARSIRQLFGPSKLSTREAMWYIFTGRGLPHNQWPLQEGEGESSWRWEAGSSKDQFEFGYRQVWLYAWRHWTELIAECPKKEDNDDTPVPQRPDPKAWHGMASLAAKVGFESDEIDRMRSLDPDREMAREALFRARDPEQFRYADSELDGYVAELSRIFKRASEIRPQEKKPDMLVPGPGEDVKRRSGRVFANAYKADRRHLFLPQIYDQGCGQGSGLSSFAVRVSVFFSFFGRLLPAQDFDAPVAAIATGPSNEPMARSESHPLESRPLQNGSQEPTTSNANAAMSGPSSLEEMPLIPAATETGRDEVLTMNETTQQIQEDLATDIIDTEMADTVKPHLSKIFIMAWKEGRLLKFLDPEPMEKPRVETLMKGLEGRGYHLISTRGRVMTPDKVYTEITKNKSHAVIISKEAEVTRQMQTAISQWSRQKEHKQKRVDG